MRVHTEGTNCWCGACDDHWETPQQIEEDGRARWVEANARKMTELTTEANKSFLLYDDGVYVPVVKLVRQERRTWVVEQPGGYYFEVLNYHAFQDKQPNEKTIAAYLTGILSGRCARHSWRN